MLRAHPGLRFDAVHLASLEWDVDRVADFLERFPNASVDLAARLVHLEYQATRDPPKVRQFLLRYQDRILYGSDDAYGPADADDRRRGGRARRLARRTGGSWPASRSHALGETSQPGFQGLHSAARGN